MFLGGATLSGRLLGCEGKASKSASFLRDKLYGQRVTRKETMADGASDIGVGPRVDPNIDGHPSRVKRDIEEDESQYYVEVDPLYFEYDPEGYVSFEDNGDEVVDGHVSDDGGGVGRDDVPGRVRRGVHDNRAAKAGPEPIHPEPGFAAEAPETGRWMGDSYSNGRADGLRPWPPRVKAEGVDLLSLHPCSGELPLFYSTVLKYVTKFDLHYRYGPLWKMFLRDLV